MAKTWVLIASSGRARIFAVNRPEGPLEELEVLVHPEAWMHERDLTSALPGRASNSPGAGCHGVDQKVSPKEQASIEFAKQIGNRLKTAVAVNDFEKLVLVAAPSFLGLLRKSLRPDVLRRVKIEIDKNLVRLDAASVRKHLPDFI